MNDNLPSEFHLPSGWEWVRLADLVANPKSDIVDGPFGSNLKASEYTAEGIPIIRIQNVDRNEFVRKNISFISREKAAELKRHGFRPGDIVITKLGAPLGRACIVPKDIGNGIVVADIVRARVEDSLAKYLSLAINIDAVARQLRKRTKGTTRPRVNLGHIRQVLVPVAPLHERTRIVQAIESYLTRLDDAVATLERVQQNLKRYRASVLKSAVEGRLVPTEAELARQEGRGYEPATVLLEHILEERRRRWIEDTAEKARARAEEKARKTGKRWTPKDDTKTLEQERIKAAKKYQEPDPPDTSDLPKLPEGWCYVTLPSLLLAINAGMKTGPFGSLLKKHEHRLHGIPVVGIENIEPMRFVIGSKIHVSADKAVQLSGYDVRPGDLLISRSGTVGEVCVCPPGLGEARFSTNVMRVRFVVEAAGPEFVCLLLNGSPFVTGQFSAQCKGTTRAFLNQRILSRLVCPLPPANEQIRINAEVERHLSILDRLASATHTTMQRSRRLRQSILKWAFEGKLVPQDPNDEPASLLLERIKAERANAAPGTKGNRRGGSERRAR